MHMGTHMGGTWFPDWGPVGWVFWRKNPLSPHPIKPRFLAPHQLQYHRKSWQGYTQSWQLVWEKAGMDRSWQVLQELGLAAG